MSGPSGDERQRALRREQLLGEEVHGVLLDAACAAAPGGGAVEAGLAVRVGGDDELADQRPVGAGGDRHVGAAGELEHLERVAPSSCRGSGCRRPS